MCFKSIACNALSAVHGHIWLNLPIVCIIGCRTANSANCYCSEILYDAKPLKGKKENVALIFKTCIYF